MYSYCHCSFTMQILVSSYNRAIQRDISYININEYMWSEKHDSTVQIQLNISIGHRRYSLLIEKNRSLFEEVTKFLNANKLNPRYVTPIMKMVGEELAKRQQQIQQSGLWMSMKNQIKEQNMHNNSISSPQKQNRNAQSNLSHNENQINEKDTIKHEERDNQHKECQNVYEKWKEKEKAKFEIKTAKEKRCNKKIDNQLHLNVKQNKEKTVQEISKKVQNHDSGYFYRKGLQFEDAKKRHQNELFHEHYPFASSHCTSLTPTRKRQLHDRLYMQSKRKEQQKDRKKLESAFQAKPKLKTDKIREKVKERDKKINRTLHDLVVEGKINNPYKISQVCKSPFRRTRVF